MIPMWIPPLPAWNTKPITLYSYMDSIVNYGKPENEKTKTRELAQASRSTIFDFDYPLSTKVTKENFETQILNHYIMRRIGFDTPTAFEIALENKLNEIMPMYNKMFDMMRDWDIFNDLEVETREQSTTTDLHSNSTTNTDGTDSETSDRRYSKTPQDELSNVRDGKYITDYNYDTNSSTNHKASTDSSNSNGAGSLNETITRTKDNKMDLYVKYKNEMSNIMTLIYKDLDVLFYGLI